MKSNQLFITVSLFIWGLLYFSGCESPTKEDTEISQSTSGNTNPLIVESKPESVSLSVSILEGGVFAISGDSQSLLVQKKPSKNYQGMDYEITMSGSIANIIYCGNNICNMQPLNFFIMVDKRPEMSKLVTYNIPVLPGCLPMPQEKSFSLKFRSSKQPEQNIMISFDVNFIRC